MRIPASEPERRLSLRTKTFAKAASNGRDAPKPDLMLADQVYTLVAVQTDSCSAPFSL